MTINPRDVLEHRDDPKCLSELIDTSKTQVTTDINMTSVASQILLASNLSHGSSTLATAVAAAAATLSASLGEHAKARLRILQQHPNATPGASRWQPGLFSGQPRIWF